MVTIKKTLVYSFFVNKEWADAVTNRIHFECLKSYSYIFDEVKITLLIDDVNDTNTIASVEKFFLDIFKQKEITFKVLENNIFREASVFYNEIASKIGKIDGLVFFAHNKGITNVTDGYEVDSIYRWITSMYFLSLGYGEEVVKKLTDERYIAYGSLPDFVNAEENSTPYLDMGKGNFMYTGTFFWLNAGTLNNYLSKSNTQIPQFTDRWYAENFLANTVPFKCCTAHEGRYVIDYIGGRKYIKYLIERAMSDTTKEEFSHFNDNILEKVGLR